eukprot:TRINITY_DN9897_c0_g1_i4.p1 TRINITY_DN9897_c0_g1~~TRINITY_DN9897_c0_g1_i4.p1  ORF type:complete len:288 (+),score=42.85 TRINITY_DN9897_c0_g1_i4:355-1218(+)
MDVKVASKLGIVEAWTPDTPIVFACMQVQSVSWSLGGDNIMTSSKDSTVKIWNAKTQCLLTMMNANHNFKRKADHEGNAPFKDLQSAQFYYMDKFVVAAHGSSVSLYKYYLDPKVDDLKRYENKSRYQEVVRLAHGQAQGITTMAAVNSFHSYLVLTAGSDRSLAVMDMNVARIARCYTSAQAKPVHRVCINEGSSFVSHPTAFYNTFATTAVTDGVALWDLRAADCVRRYDSHVSRTFPAGIALSPCGRFLATGSEDKCCYVYDTRYAVSQASEQDACMQGATFNT